MLSVFIIIEIVVCLPAENTIILKKGRLDSHENLPFIDDSRAFMVLSVR